ncbi:DUF2232 domain-containing protein [Allorhizobium sp. BGMRC 0089]|uniref:DUF2232 domain-containing protein n=1 Tax=Allorhizobium sonneratiae TaxID=2934936 RepID=UPI0020337BBB|nr:DUF2232 domain-containing protein [Allorhizobium sonneratiae]MCM2292045.1 DUF2232 domain-containing protein [Allorhizobium sonneratiae]
MKQPDVKLLLTGILAGVTAIFLALAANAQPSFSSMLYAASAMPVMIVSLRWGNLHAIIAIVTAIIIGALAVSPLFALAMAIFTLLPAGWISHLANLARPASEIGGPDNLMAWYPLSDILMHLCMIVSFAVIFLGVMIGYGADLVGSMVDALVQALSLNDPATAAAIGSSDRLKPMLLLVLPIMQGAMWVLMLFAAFYLAGRIVSASGQTTRPREDVPSALRMNRNAPFMFLAGIIACFIGGIPALIGATVCGAFGAGFLMGGFASIHERTRGKEWRLPALILCYMAAILVFPALFIMILGLIDTRRTVALTPPRPGDTPPKQQDNKQ